MIPLIGHNGCLIICVVAVIAASAAGWTLNGWRMSGERERLSADHAAYVAAAERSRVEAESKYRLAEREAADSLLRIADNYREELNNARNRNESLRVDIESGRRRLSVAARCPASGSMPADTATAGGADAAGAELDPGARSNYFSLRADVERAEQQIAGLQDYARQCYLLQSQAR